MLASLQYLQSTDSAYDAGHNSDHCLEVNQIIQQSYRHTGTHFDETAERRILTFSALFHEQNDPKFGVEADCHQLRSVMTADGVPEEEQNVVLELITKCSFKCRHAVPSDNQWIGLLHLLCSADLATAVGEKALERSFHFHQRRLSTKKTVSDEDVWSHVYQYYQSPVDGYFPRLEAITVRNIRDMVEPFIEVNRLKIQSLATQYGFSNAQ